jgi:hypothetical protein
LGVHAPPMSLPPVCAAYLGALPQATLGDLSTLVNLLLPLPSLVREELRERRVADEDDVSRAMASCRSALAAQLQSMRSSIDLSHKQSFVQLGCLHFVENFLMDCDNVAPHTAAIMDVREFEALLLQLEMIRCLARTMARPKAPSVVYEAVLKKKGDAWLRLVRKRFFRVHSSLLLEYFKTEHVKAGIIRGSMTDVRSCTRDSECRLRIAGRLADGTEREWILTLDSIEQQAQLHTVLSTLLFIHSQCRAAAVCTELGAPVLPDDGRLADCLTVLMSVSPLLREAWEEVGRIVGQSHHVRQTQKIRCMDLISANQASRLVRIQAELLVSEETTATRLESFDRARRQGITEWDSQVAALKLADATTAPKRASFTKDVELLRTGLQTALQAETALCDMGKAAATNCAIAFFAERSRAFAELVRDTKACAALHRSWEWEAPQLLAEILESIVDGVHRPSWAQAELRSFARDVVQRCVAELERLCQLGLSFAFLVDQFHAQSHLWECDEAPPAERESHMCTFVADTCSRLADEAPQWEKSAVLFRLQVPCRDGIVELVHSEVSSRRNELLALFRRQTDRNTSAESAAVQALQQQLDSCTVASVWSAQYEPHSALAHVEAAVANAHKFAARYIAELSLPSYAKASIAQTAESVREAHLAEPLLCAQLRIRLREVADEQCRSCRVNLTQLCEDDCPGEQRLARGDACIRDSCSALSRVDPRIPQTVVALETERLMGFVRGDLSKLQRTIQQQEDIKEALQHEIESHLASWPLRFSANVLLDPLRSADDALASFQMDKASCLDALANLQARIRAMPPYAKLSFTSMLGDGLASILAAGARFAELRVALARDVDAEITVARKEILELSEDTAEPAEREVELTRIVPAHVKRVEKRWKKFAGDLPKHVRPLAEPLKPVSESRLRTALEGVSKAALVRIHIQGELHERASAHAQQVMRDVDACLLQVWEHFSVVQADHSCREQEQRISTLTNDCNQHLLSMCLNGERLPKYAGERQMKQVLNHARARVVANDTMLARRKALDSEVLQGIRVIVSQLQEVQNSEEHVSNRRQKLGQAQAQISHLQHAVELTHANAYVSRMLTGIEQATSSLARAAQNQLASDEQLYQRMAVNVRSMMEEIGALASRGTSGMDLKFKADQQLHRIASLIRELPTYMQREFLGEAERYFSEVQLAQSVQSAV